jgi:hypothetical protein
MKKTAILLLMTVFCAGMAMAQKSTAKKLKVEKITAPDLVVNSFNQKFMGAIPEWTKTPNGNFVAAIDNNGMKQYAEFNAEGKWLNTATEIPFEQLTEAAQAKIKEQYADMQVEKVKKIERENISVFYKVKLVKDKESKMVYINDAGFISG